MKCISCGHETKLKKIKMYHYIFSGLQHVFLQDISSCQCTNKNCLDEEVILPNLEQLHQLIANTLAREERTLHPEEIRFLRSYLGFSGKDFAAKIGVTPETVSRWEKGVLKMSPASEKLLRVLIISQTAPFRDYDQLDRFGSKSMHSGIKQLYKLKKTTWHSKVA